jgi:hypothetical protein
VLKFEGAYHGQHPVGITSMINGRPATLPQSDPSGAGAAWVERDVLVAPYNDLAATEQILADHGHELAAVIIEPLHRCLTPVPGFLAGLREATRRRGIVLVFDEVVTGFRLALGGAQQYYGVVPDLVAYGKALGGGFPLGAYAGSGRADGSGQRTPSTGAELRVVRLDHGRQPGFLCRRACRARPVFRARHLRMAARLRPQLPSAAGRGDGGGRRAGADPGRRSRWPRWLSRPNR